MRLHASMPCFLNYMLDGLIPHIDFVRVLEYNNSMFWQIYTVDVHMNDKSASSFETPRSYAGRFLHWRSFYGLYVYFRSCGKVECIE